MLKISKSRRKGKTSIESFALSTIKNKHVMQIDSKRREQFKTLLADAMLIKVSSTALQFKKDNYSLQKLNEEPRQVDTMIAYEEQLQSTSNTQ